MDNDQLKLLERRLKREKNARRQAENLLETKSLELYKANTELQTLADSQEDQIRKRTEELKIARDKALKASETKSNFLATMSHEIRTPMNGVIGMAQLLLDTELNSKQRRQLSVLLSSSESLLQIINDVLDLSKLESGKLDIQQQRFSLSELIDDILNSLAITSAQKKLELINIIDPNIPDQLIGDPTRLRQILINLLGNAIKFTDVGYVLLKLSIVKKTSKDNITVKFEVTDTGKGISAEDIEKLFKPFSQIMSTKYDKKLQQGTGLGLSICKKLTDIMQGDIGVSSEKGITTTFWLQLPLTIASQTAKPQPPSKNIYFYQPLETIRALETEQLNTLCHKVTVSTELDELIQISKKGFKDNELLLIDSENLDKEEYLHLIEHLENQSIEKNSSDKKPSNKKPINNKQWIFIQSVNETNLKLSNYCEVNNISTIIKPVSQLKLAKALYPEQFITKETSAITNTTNNFTGKKLLLAEDNRVNQMVAKALLQKQGINVTIANDGLEALEQYKEETFDLIFMDINMPRMGGIEAFEELSKIMKSEGTHTPVIALTANALEGAKEEYLALGMNGYLTKPIEMDKLTHELEKWL